MNGRLEQDKNGKDIQGFETRVVNAGTTDLVDLSDYMAICFGGDIEVEVEITINGTTQPKIKYQPGTIRVCKGWDSIQCTTPAPFELM